MGESFFCAPNSVLLMSTYWSLVNMGFPNTRLYHLKIILILTPPLQLKNTFFFFFYLSICQSQILQAMADMLTI